MSNGYSRRRVGGVVVGAALAVGVAAVLSVKYFIAPMLIRQQLEQAVEQRWQGAVAIRHIRFRYFGPVRLEGVVLADRRGRRWAEADAMTLPSPAGRLWGSQAARIRADRLTINAYLEAESTTSPEGGRKSPVIHPPAAGPYGGQAAAHESSRRESYLAALTGSLFTGDGSATGQRLESLIVENLALMLWDGPRSLKVLDRAAVALRRDQDQYEVRVREKTDAVWREFSAWGHIRRADGQVALHVKAERLISPEDGAFLTTLWNWPAGWSADGSIRIDVALSGPVSRPDELAPEGMVRFAGCSVRSGDRHVVQDLGMRVRLQGRRYEVHDLACGIYGGQLGGTLWALIDPAAPAVGGDLTGRDISVKELVAEIGVGGGISQGTVSGTLKFATCENTGGLCGSAVLLFRDTSSGMFPLSMKIMAAMGLDAADPHEPSDLACAFDFSGTQGTIRQSRFVNRAAALETQSGGVLDVANGQVDLYVMALPAGDVNAAGGLARAADIQQMHVAGSYWDSPSELITKEPVAGVRRETVRFLQSAVNRKSAGGVSGGPPDPSSVAP